MKGIFVTEASQAVGFGHLMECLAIAESVSQVSDVYFLMVDSDPKAWSHVRNAGYLAINVQDVKEISRYDFILLNTRKNKFALQEALFAQTDRLVVLDELGGIALKCHKLINFSINEDWHQYTWSGIQPKFFLGPLYFPLRAAFAHVTQQNYDKGRVMVTLGGVDRSRSILRVAEFLSKYRSMAAHYIIGPGCRQRAEDLEKIIAEHSKQKILIAPDNFEEIMAKSEFVVCSGGNTLYEAAFLKKKVAVVWEDEHERIHGECFEKTGRAKIVGGPKFIDEGRFESLLKGQAQFCEHTDVDGKGVNRICHIITEM